MRTTLERELKLDADPAFEFPDLAGEKIEARLFTSTYYDTPSRSLLRSGITLRRRVENGLSNWQLKLPREENLRAELESAGGPAGPPPELLRLLTAHLRHGALAPVATLRTRRVGVRVGDDGHRVAEVTLDSVDILEGQRQAGTFRELEIELLDGDVADLDRLARVLRRAGAQRSDGRPKVARALGFVELEAGDGVQAALRRQLRELEACDPGARLGDDPEDVHRLRVATRRARAILAATGALLGGRLAPLEDELRWLGGLLGPVRDLDVLLDHLRVEVVHLDGDRAAGESFVAALEEERERSRDLLLEGLDSARYLDLLALFEAEVDAPFGIAEGDLRAIAVDELDKLRKRSRLFSVLMSDDEFHDLRKSAKRARYAAELVGGTRKLVGALKTLQDIIGEHQDAVVAEGRLRKLARARTAVAAGRLIERGRERKRHARAVAPKALDLVLAQAKKAL